MPLAPELSEEFRERFAAWLRIEPRCRQDDFAEGIRARTADALWMLARQWQTGEFSGEDAGSPVAVELGYSTQPVERIKLGNETPVAHPAAVPLETAVERELGALTYRERVRVGQEFERRLLARLKAAGAQGELDALLVALRAQDTLGFPRTPRTPLHKLDRATQRFVRFMEGRVLDGAAVLERALPVPEGSPLGAAELEEVRQSVLHWYEQVCARPATGLAAAWHSEGLGYRFETNDYAPEGVPDAARKTRLLAPDYRNGALDWHTFSAAPEGARGPWQAPAEPALNPLRATPTRIEISGTSPRWWAFEDGNTDFGSLDVAKPDLTKLLLMEFVLIYGDDWFSVPAPVALGSLVKIDQLRVRNVFGDLTFVEPARKIAGDPNERFELFTISPAADPAAHGLGVASGGSSTPPRPLLFVPPVAGFRQESAPLDEVRFLRDEGANMVWAVEQIVPNGLGRPIDGFDAQRERLERENEVELAGLEALIREARLELDGGALSDARREELRLQIYLAQARIEELNPRATPPTTARGVPRYRLATTVPENWIPFIPVQRHDAPLGDRYTAIQFRRAQMLRNTDHERMHAGELVEPSPVPAMSRLLALDEQALLWIDEEAVPRAGLRIQLTKQRARWIDGTTHVWLGRKVLTGRGEGASGLRFDTADSGR